MMINIKEFDVLHVSERVEQYYFSYIRFIKCKKELVLLRHRHFMTLPYRWDHRGLQNPYKIWFFFQFKAGSSILYTYNQDLLQYNKPLKKISTLFVFKWK